ncbi:MAG: radical SAM protein [Muribaculaceae bacterium]|nr:radical SAM protein [Muribaculaceae bacterium]
MYKIKDYLRNGVILINNIIFHKKKKLSQLMIYATNRCQSRCKHCQIWQKSHDSLSKEEIVSLISSKCIDRYTTVGLEGGEFVLHPQAAEIMEWFHINHPNYTLLSNCLAPDKVIDLTRRYRPKHLFLSLDGNRETYKTMRGVDGYDKVIRVIEELKDEIPISLMFCLSPFNSFKDMEYTIDIAKKYGIDIRIGIYGKMAYFDTQVEMLRTQGENYISHIPSNIHDTQENYDFVVLYDQWRNGNLRLRCHSINNSLIIHPDGNVPVCQNLDVILGNIKEKTLDDIFNSAESVSTQCRLSKECNGCWINFHRKYDIILLRNLEKILPKSIIETFYGKYQWNTDRKLTYRKYLKRVKDEKINK